MWMSDRHDDSPGESPMQRAMRMRKAAMASKQVRGGERFHGKPPSGIAAGASKPWMKK